MGEPAVSLGSVPVLYFRRYYDHSAGLETYCIFAFFLIPAAACSADKYLSAACRGMMYMPVVAASRLKCDIGKAYSRFAWSCQGIEIGIAGKIPGKSGVFGSGTKYIDLFKTSLSEIFILCLL